MALDVPPPLATHPILNPPPHWHTRPHPPGCPEPIPYYPLAQVAVSGKCTSGRRIPHTTAPRPGPHKIADIQTAPCPVCGDNSTDPSAPAVLLPARRSVSSYTPSQPSPPPPHSRPENARNRDATLQSSRRRPHANHSGGSSMSSPEKEKRNRARPSPSHRPQSPVVLWNRFSTRSKHLQTSASRRQYFLF